MGFASTVDAPPTWTLADFAVNCFLLVVTIRWAVPPLVLVLVLAATAVALARPFWGELPWVDLAIFWRVASLVYWTAVF